MLELSQDFEEIERVREEYEKYRIRSKGGVNLSLTHRCTWRCVFCYKGCPRSGPEMTADDLRSLAPKLFDDNLSFSLTGGEPTLHEAWRSIAAYAAGRGRKIGMITNASRISDEDIDFIAKTLLSIKLSIHALTPQTAYEMTKSKEQRGLEVLRKLSQKVDGCFKISVTTLILRPNMPEIIPLLEEFERIHDETGKPDRIGLSVPYLTGSMLQNLDLYPSPEEWENLKREIESQGFNLNIDFEKYGVNYNRALPPFSSCFELEPDGYGYFEGLNIKVGSWRKHSPKELLLFWYRKGYQIVYEALKRGEILRELPDFKVKKRVQRWLRVKAKDYFETESGCVVVLEDGRLFEFEGRGYFALMLAQLYPLEKLQDAYGESFRTLIDQLIGGGIAEIYEVETLFDVEVVD